MIQTSEFLVKSDFILIALSLAKDLRLERLDNLSCGELKDEISRLSAPWYGVDMVQQGEALKDTWRQLWCCLFVADHDYLRITCDSILFSFQVYQTGIQIHEPMLTNESIDKLV